VDLKMIWVCEQRGPTASRVRAIFRAAGLAALLGTAVAAGGQGLDSKPAGSVAASLPNAPSALLAGMGTQNIAAAKEDQAATPENKPGQTSAKPSAISRRHTVLPCPVETAPAAKTMAATPQLPPPCRAENPIQLIVTSKNVQPLTSNEKGLLAIRDFVDPFNFATIAAYSAVVVAANAHSPYGPGLAGFGRLTGYGLAADARGEFFETYAIPSLLHEDPRYHRMPEAGFKRRVWHAVEHTYVSQHDDGRPMPNYATLLSYPISGEISDLYVPGIQTDLRSTGKRVAIGIATDPAGALVAEFLPDVAKHLRVHIVFVQEILNRMVVGAPGTQ
jgi:hypothetical protein